MEVIAVIPITKGQWQGTTEIEWTGLYFLETLLDFSLFKGCVGKLYVETMHSSRQYGGSIRLAYVQKIGEWIPIEGSEIYTKKTHEPKDWELMQSEWFALPTVEGVSCVWIQAKAEQFKTCQVAFATLTIAKDSKEIQIFHPFKESEG